MAAMVNMSNLLNGKDSRWLQLEVCREFQRNKCSRPDTECKFAHPPANVEVQNGRVTACYDSIKGRCNREKPPCKYFHPPQHLKDQLLINGRNHLALKNALMQQMGMAATPTPTQTILQSPLQPMTANRFLPTSNPYNPYFTTGALLPTSMLGPEHAANALAGTSPMSPQAVPLGSATNNAAQPQKRTDRVQIFPGLLPYKRPAPDKPTAAGIQTIYQPSAAAYQQLMQLQSAQQSYVPVSSQQNSINQSSPSSKAIIPSNIIDNNTLNTKNVAVAAPVDDDGGDNENALNVQNAKTQINANGIDVAKSVAVNATNNASDLVVEENNNKSINEMSINSSSDLSKQNINNSIISVAKSNNNNNNNSISHVVDDATKTSIQSAIDESNLNAISFNSANSSSPAAATLSAIYTTNNSITTSVNISNNNNNNNNNILSRKNSLTTPNQHLINNSSSKNHLNTNNGKVDNVPDLINASSLNNPQAALLSAVFYNQPYQQLAMTPNLYSDPAQLAKEMAQKNYVNALKLAAAAQTPTSMAQTANMAGKTYSTNPLTALSYPGMAMSANNNAAAAAAMFNQANQMPGSSATTQQRYNAQISSQNRAQYMPAALTRSMQNPYQHTFIRPQLQTPNLTNAAAAASNPYFAAHQQFLNQQNLFYSGLTSPLASPQMTATTVASQMTSPFAASASYPYSALSQAQALSHAQSLPTSMMQVPQITSQTSQTGGTSAVVLNPYKKMKTS
ncbi:tyrosine-protein phosphatase 3-like isoform X2 [Chironomus tepperi]|uniref:tyrosine-protein phosphatase 3-like isoform X2 n=1 Tax=Chironomus tepperi TaxID=113505 RepID=UPI00391FA65B